MRNCPVCDEAVRVGPYPYDNGFTYFVCIRCGHIYIDQQYIDQSHYDRYYNNADTSYDLHDEESTKRLQALADYIRTFKGVKRIADMGGYFSDFAGMLPEYEVTGYNAGMWPEGEVDMVIYSHSLEHVYDMNTAMEKITAVLKPGGSLVIEVPIFIDYGESSEDYDWHWYHINKFRVQDLIMLLQRFGYTNLRGGAVDDFRKWHCYRITGEKP